MGIIIFFFLCGYLASVFTSGMQKKAGYNIIDAFIPIKGNLNMAAMIDKPKYWAILCYTPVFNFFVLATIFSDLARSFGKERFYQYLSSMLFPFAYLPYIGFNQEDNYYGVPSKEKKGGAREWSDAISFALVAATLIRWSTFEAYTIPTPSMEGSLLVGDFLFVSKLHYGPRTPITPLQVPLTHQYLWLTGDPVNNEPGVKAYSDAIQFPYNRIGGITDIKNNDVVVFNWPADLQHTAVDLKTNYIKRCIAIAGDDIEVKNRVVYINGKKTKDPEKRQFTYWLRFKDQKNIANLLQQGRSLNSPAIQNYLHSVDRSIYNKTGQHMLNDHGVIILDRSTVGNYYHALISCDDKQYKQLLRFDQIFDRIPLAENKDVFNLEIPVSDKEIVERIHHQYNYNFNPIKLTSNTIGYENRYESRFIDSLKKYAPEVKVISNQKESFYFMKHFISNPNNFGPVHVPAKGEKIQMTAENVKKFGYLISTYDHNDNVEIKGEKLFIEDKEIKEYTFNQNYYFMMGDNRNNSQDSRYWGFVPEDHVVGKAALIWFSLSNEEGSIFTRVRWSRLLNLIE